MSSKQIVSNAEALVDFSYNPQIHDWGWISFHLKEENAWDIIEACIGGYQISHIPEVNRQETLINWQIFP